jgi:hypothetical protein
MAFPLSIDVDSLPARGYSSTLRFTRCRALRRTIQGTDLLALALGETRTAVVTG